MTLPFEKTDPSQRIYTCFVCGLAFKEIEKYKSHILEKHEEGREYVVCPLKRCGYPVRDLRIHFKTIHKHESLPKIGQMKALVWIDQRDPKAKRKKKPVFREGYFISNKNNGKQLHYRSGFENDVYECLEKMNEVLAYDVEPFSVDYWFKGERKKYWPDLMIKFVDHIEIWEVKPATQTKYEINEVKWTACENYCQMRGWIFQVKTEKGLELLKNKVK